METVPFNDGEKITDVTLSDGSSIFDDPDLDGRSMAYVMYPRYGNYKNEKHLLIEFCTQINGVNTTLMISSVTGDFLRDDSGKPLRISSTIYPTEYTKNYTFKKEDEWMKFRVVEIDSEKTDRCTLIDYGGNFILKPEFGNEYRFKVMNDKGEWINF